MKKEQVMIKLRLVLTAEELRRIRIKEKGAEVTCIDVDLHGLGCKMSQRLVRNLINIIREEFVLNVIHGFNHGTALKQMVMSTEFSERVIGRICPEDNPGITYLRVAA